MIFKPVNIVRRDEELVATRQKVPLRRLSVKSNALVFARHGHSNLERLTLALRHKKNLRGWADRYG